MQSVLQDAYQRHPKATPICTAFRIENHERFNDDGEPSGTAGLSMLAILRKQDVIDVMALVIVIMVVYRWVQRS